MQSYVACERSQQPKVRKRVTLFCNLRLWAADEYEIIILTGHSKSQIVNSKTLCRMIRQESIFGPKVKGSIRQESA
jgi:hypothetical protein